MYMMGIVIHPKLSDLTVFVETHDVNVLINELLAYIASYISNIFDEWLTKGFNYLVWSWQSLCPRSPPMALHHLRKH